MKAITSNRNKNYKKQTYKNQIHSTTSQNGQLTTAVLAGYENPHADSRQLLGATYKYEGLHPPGTSSKGVFNYPKSIYLRCKPKGSGGYLGKGQTGL